METYATTKGQIVIPADLRKKFGIKGGTRFEITDDGERIILRPITSDYIRSLRGSLKGTKALQILEQERRMEKES